jgi:hypothetical protein
LVKKRRGRERGREGKREEREERVSKRGGKETKRGEERRKEGKRDEEREECSREKRRDIIQVRYVGLPKHCTNSSSACNRSASPELRKRDAREFSRVGVKTEERVTHISHLWETLVVAPPSTHTHTHTLSLSLSLFLASRPYRTSSAFSLSPSQTGGMVTPSSS